MELCLNPIFYIQVGATSPGTMHLLSKSKKGVQKVAIGDQSGILTYFGMKRGDANIVFKTLPGPGINRLHTGSAADRIFVSSEATVTGFNRNGKQFLSYNPNLTEHIKTMCVEGSNLFVCGMYIFNHYVDLKDTHYYLSSDKINDILCLPPTEGGPPFPVLACWDNSLRILKGSELLYEMEVAGPPLCAIRNGSDGGEGNQEVLYGTQNGKMGLVKLMATEPSYRWDMLNENKYGGIQCMATADITGDGVPDILVGRDDGVVEVYGFDESNEPRLLYTHVFSDSISSVDGGVVGSSDYEEVIVATYSGRVYGLTRDQAGPSKISREVQAKLEVLKEEVVNLETKLGKAKESFVQTLDQARDKSDGTLAAVPMFQVNDKFLLNQDEAWYTLSIETQACLDMIVLQSDVPLELQDVDKSTAVISYTPPDPENGNYLLATLRCINTNRLEVKVYSVEGQYGMLQAYITPCMEPKSCLVRQYQIKPLSLHRRVHSFDDNLMQSSAAATFTTTHYNVAAELNHIRPLNSLKLTGPFSLGDSHSWVRFCLQDVPEQPASEDINMLYFKSTFIDTQLECIYKTGEIIFRSDNMSTISLIKEVLSKETTRKKIAVKVTYDMNDLSVSHMLDIIFPKLEAQLMLAKNVQLIEALQEIKLNEEDTSFLSPQCQLILGNAEAMKEELKQRPSLIERLYALIIDLYMDRANFKGLAVKDNVGKLHEILDDCDYPSLLQFFEIAPLEK